MMPNEPRQKCLRPPPASYSAAVGGKRCDQFMRLIEHCNLKDRRGTLLSSLFCLMGNAANTATMGSAAAGL